MVFNHYAKLTRIIATLDDGWYIKRIDSPTTTTRFDGGRNHYEYYYRLYTAQGDQVPYGKFQKLDTLARMLEIDASMLPVKS